MKNLPNYILKIRDILKDKGYTYKEFARLMGRAESTVVNYLMGRTKMDIETLNQIAETLGVTVCYILDCDKNVNNVSDFDGIGSIENKGVQIVSKGSSEAEKEIAQLKIVIDSLKILIEEKERLIAEKDKLLDEKDRLLKEKDRQIDLLKEMIEVYKKKN